MPKVSGIMTLPEEDLGHFCRLYIDLWITLATVRASSDSSMTFSIYTAKCHRTYKGTDP